MGKKLKNKQNKVCGEENMVCGEEKVAIKMIKIPEKENI